MHKIDFSSRARRELLDSYRWYEEQPDGLGDRFGKAIYAAAYKAAKAPEMYAIRFRNFRQLQLRKFPFLLVFQIKKDTILITSIFQPNAILTISTNNLFATFAPVHLPQNRR